MYTPTPEIHFDQPSSQEPYPTGETPAPAPDAVAEGQPVSTSLNATTPPEDPATQNPVTQEPTIRDPYGQETPTFGPSQAPTYWTNGYGMLPPYPPYGPSVDASPRRPRRRWMPALLTLLALLLTLGAGVGIGVAASNRPASSTHTVYVGATSAPALNVSSSTSSLQQSVESAAKAAEPSVVKITSTGGQSEGVGSGDILTADGYIVTNDHVVNGFTTFTVTLSTGKSYSATLVGEDAQDDLAVVKINATGLTPIAFADSSKVQVGEFAVAVGNPLALQESATFGTVSALNGSASEAPNGPAGLLTGLLQTTATIAPGNSGGALVNLQGQIIGIPTIEEINPDTRSAAGIGYAIASNRVQYVAQQIIQNGSLTSTGQGFMGIQAEDVTPQLAAADGLSVQSGVLISKFYNDAAGQSPAQQAGLQAGDVITAVDGQAVSNSSDLSSVLSSKAPGTQVTLTIVRGSNTSTVAVTLGERPTNTQG